MTEKKPKKKRPAPLSFRVPKDRRAEFLHRWERSGKSLSAFVVDNCIEADMPRQIRRPPVEAKLLARELAILAGIWDELKRYRARDEHNDAIEERLDKIHGILVERRSASFQRLGRRS